MGSILFDDWSDATSDSTVKSDGEKNQLLSKETLEQSAAPQNDQSDQRLELTVKSDEQLLLENLSILGLTETNEILKRQNEDYECKLNVVIKKSAELVEAYEKDLAAKTKLIDLYKENSEACSHEYQAHVNELEDAVKTIRQFLYQSLDRCELLESNLNEIEEKHKIELDEKDKLITALKQELKQMTDFTNAYEEENNNQKDTQHDHESLEHVLTSDVDNCCLKMHVTCKESHTECSVKKNIEVKKREDHEFKMQNRKNDLSSDEKLKNFLSHPDFTVLKNLMDDVDAFSKHIGAKFQLNVTEVDEDSQQQLADMIANVVSITISDDRENGFSKNADALQTVGDRDFPTKDGGSSTMLPQPNRRMMLRPKKKPRTDTKDEVIILSDDEDSVDEINVCDVDDEDVVLVRTQADLLRDAFFSVRAKIAKRKTDNFIFCCACAEPVKRKTKKVKLTDSRNSREYKQRSSDGQLPSLVREPGGRLRSFSVQNY